LKLEKITPIFKKEDPHLVENYRPISLLPSISKIFEKVVAQQIITYFNNNKHVCPQQCGFRAQHSTEHAILDTVDKIAEALNKGNTPIGIFLDLSMVFDTLDHKILLDKLKYYGIKDTALTWFESYLSERRQ
jgi:hypothetical protein